MASVKWSEEALDSLATLDPFIREQVLSKVSWLEGNFGVIVRERLHGELKNTYKLRVGDYRAIYSVPRRDSIIIERVGHRSTIYK